MQYGVPQGSVLGPLLEVKTVFVLIFNVKKYAILNTFENLYLKCTPGYPPLFRFLSTPLIRPIRWVHSALFQAVRLATMMARVQCSCWSVKRQCSWRTACNAHDSAETVRSACTRGRWISRAYSACLSLNPFDKDAASNAVPDARHLIVSVCHRGAR